MAIMQSVSAVDAAGMEEFPGGMGPMVTTTRGVEFLAHPQGREKGEVS
jgi:hypothetical protein